MAGKTQFDFSLKNVPDSWSEASDVAGFGDANPLPPKKLMTRTPTRDRADLFAGTMAAAGLSVVAGSAWYFAATRLDFNPYWLSIVLAFLMGSIVRLAAGKPNPELRAALSCLFYLVVLVPIAFLITRYELKSIRSTTDFGFAVYEDAFISQWIGDTKTATAWAIGLAAVVVVSYLRK